MFMLHPVACSNGFIPQSSVKPFRNCRRRFYNETSEFFLYLVSTVLESLKIKGYRPNAFAGDRTD